MSAKVSHIIFLHIPKAGGTTLRNVLYHQYSRRNIYEIGEDVNGDIKHFKGLAESKRKKIKLLSGHMSHGLHIYLPGRSLYLTMLRDPVKRVYSEYRFLSSNTLHPLYAIVSKLTFREYLHVNPTRQANNGQTRLLSGNSFDDQTGIPGIIPLGRNDLEKALKNLKVYFPTIGLLERFDETLLLWRCQLGWRPPFYEKKNITARSSEPLDDADVAYVRELNRYDLILYDMAVTYFNENLRQQPESFKKQLSLFRVMNQVYRRLVICRRTGKQKWVSAKIRFKNRRLQARS